MDGSGKTTLAKKLKEYLEEKGHHVFFKHAHGYAISQDSFAIDEQNIKRFRWLFFLLSPLTLLDSLFTYYFTYKPRLKHSTIICDRYFYDKIARLLFYKVINRGLAKVYLALTPKPNFHFFLFVDEKKAFERKPEYNQEEFKLLKNSYNFVAKYLKTYSIHTNQPVRSCMQKLIHYLNI